MCLLFLWCWETITQSAKICKEYKGFEKELFENMHKSEQGSSLDDVNSNITNVNNLVVSFPSSIFCSMAGVSKMSYIKEDVDDKKVLNIEL